MPAVLQTQEMHWHCVDVAMHRLEMQWIEQGQLFPPTQGSGLILENLAIYQLLQDRAVIRLIR
jgi:hypothetical protein